MPSAVPVPGRPRPKTEWELRYRRGKLDYLESRDQLAHYLVVAGYLRGLRVAPAILDVGCGTGHLLEFLEPGWCRRYVGLDLAEEAIRRGRARRVPNATFEVADFDGWTPGERFSAVVFCESLNYARRPVETLARYGRALEPGGTLVVSLYRHPGHPRLWAEIERVAAVQDATAVVNRRGQAWDVKVLAPRRA